MKAKNINNLAIPGDIEESDGIILTQGGRAVRMLMSKFRKYIGFASGADLMGVPVPTAKDAGKVPVINEDGRYELKAPLFAELLWKNENPSGAFPAQTIAHDNSAYKLFVICFQNSFVSIGASPYPSGCVNWSAIGEKNGIELRANMYNCTDDFLETWWRNVSIDDSGFTFSTGYRHYFNGKFTGGITTGESYAIPTEIYGLR